MKKNIKTYKEIHKNLFFQRDGAFTLFEILLSVGLLFIIGAITTPIIVDLYDRQENQSVSDEIVTLLRKAQAYSFYSKDDDGYGVKFDNENKYFALFKGNIFDEGDDQNEFGQMYLNTVTFDPEITGNVILFDKKTGFSSTPTQIQVTLGKFIRTFYVCENGIVDFEACN